MAVLSPSENYSCNKTLVSVSTQFCSQSSSLLFVIQKLLPYILESGMHYVLVLVNHIKPGIRVTF